jgi:serine/threonine-protein kinase
MGTVYVAEHIGLGKQVAVKVLNSQYAGHADVVARLHGEARHAAAIHNEHIVTIFDIGAIEDGRPYVVMELLQGESLAERLRRCRVLSEADTLRIGRQLASALAAAHKSGIVHRDIKPENIFLCPRAGVDFVKVLDFGISKAVSLSLSLSSSGSGVVSAGTGVSGQGQPPAPIVDPRLTRTGAILGTPLYMSPEQVRGEALDHRVDIYALGVVLYECLTGSVPFLAPSYLAVIAKILTEVPETPSQRSPERALPAALEQIVMAAMAYDRDARYPSMSTLLEDLDRYAAGRALQQATWKQSAGAELARSYDEEGKEPASRRSTWSAMPARPILSAAGAVLAAGLILTLWHGPQPSLTPPVKPEPASGSQRSNLGQPQNPPPKLAETPPARTNPPAAPAALVQAPPPAPALAPLQASAKPSSQTDAGPAAPDNNPSAPFHHLRPGAILAGTPQPSPQTPAAPDHEHEHDHSEPRSRPHPQATVSDPPPLPPPLFEEQAPNPFLPNPPGASR